MRFHYDKEADALAIELRDEPVPSMRTVEIDPGTLVDLDARGDLISIEVSTLLGTGLSRRSRALLGRREGRGDPELVVGRWGAISV